MQGAGAHQEARATSSYSNPHISTPIPGTEVCGSTAAPSGSFQLSSSSSSFDAHNPGSSANATHRSSNTSNSLTGGSRSTVIDIEKIPYTATVLPKSTEVRYVSESDDANNTSRPNAVPVERGNLNPPRPTAQQISNPKEPLAYSLGAPQAPPSYQKVVAPRSYQQQGSLPQQPPPQYFCPPNQQQQQQQQQQQLQQYPQVAGGSSNSTVKSVHYMPSSIQQQNSFQRPSMSPQHQQHQQQQHHHQQQHQQQQHQQQQPPQHQQQPVLLHQQMPPNTQKYMPPQHHYQPRPTQQQQQKQQQQQPPHMTPNQRISSYHPGNPQPGQIAPRPQQSQPQPHRPPHTVAAFQQTQSRPTLPSQYNGPTFSSTAAQQKPLFFPPQQQVIQQTDLQKKQMQQPFPSMTTSNNNNNNNSNIGPPKSMMSGNVNTFISSNSNINSTMRAKPQFAYQKVAVGATVPIPKAKKPRIVEDFSIIPSKRRPREDPLTYSQKRLCQSLECGVKSDVCWALSTLCAYSVDVKNELLIGKVPGLLASMARALSWSVVGKLIHGSFTYLPREEEKLFINGDNALTTTKGDLLSILVILHNFATVEKNAQNIGESKVMLQALARAFEFDDEEVKLEALSFLHQIALFVDLSDENVCRNIIRALFVLLNAPHNLQTTVLAMNVLARLSESPKNEAPILAVAARESVLEKISLVLNTESSNVFSSLQLLNLLSQSHVAIRKIAEYGSIIQSLIRLVCESSKWDIRGKAATVLNNLRREKVVREKLLPFEEKLAMIALSEIPAGVIVAEILLSLRQKSEEFPELQEDVLRPQLDFIDAPLELDFSSFE